MRAANGEQGDGRESPAWVPGHWIGGRWVRGGRARLEPRCGAPPFAPVGRFPVAGAAELEEAIRSARAALPRWRDLGAAEREARIRRARALLQDVPAARAVHGHLGLGVGEALPLGGPGPRRPPPDADVVLVLPHWTELLEGLGERLLPILADGSAVVLLSDLRLPESAEAWARALEQAGLEPGVLALLHGAPEPVRAQALAAFPVGAVVASGPASELGPLFGEAGREPGARLPRAGPAFDEVRGAVELVPADADPSAAARAVVDAAFGRTRTLSGQLPGQVTRVVCSDRIVSRFTAELLARLESAPDGREPLPLIDAPAVDAALALLDLGLDEGATLISGGEFRAGPDRRAGDRRLLPAVFTNVLEGMQLARRRGPGPVLSLLRAPSDAAGAELARRIG